MDYDNHPNLMHADSTMLPKSSSRGGNNYSILSKRPTREDDDIIGFASVSSVVKPKPISSTATLPTMKPGD